MYLSHDIMMIVTSLFNQFPVLALQRKPVFHWHSLHTSHAAEFPGGPKIIKPIPHGLVIIIQYLSRRRQRVVDLFARTDKDKSWGLSRKEFKNVIEEVGLN